MEPFVNIFGQLDTLQSFIEPVLLALVVANMVTRYLAHNRHVEQYEDGGADAISRFIPHEATNVLLMLASFYYLTVNHHGGMVLSMFVAGLLITDLFEFESRKVEARRDIPLDRPKASLSLWTLSLLYLGFQMLFTGTLGTIL
ncbi:hypothetical protein ACAH01_05195 [Halomicrobium sp. HM KBTZ05]|uniref:DUF7313 domain-containing protein n=1 Tax=Halomicrobium mukohataei TaxID=57705 RepID=A0A847UDX3_9EURY|nr:hypothetical protein [Halomicrobium mukohataei]NLV11389.1 hypothetical protein [Halomicrobium mukohataei]